MVHSDGSHVADARGINGTCVDWRVGCGLAAIGGVVYVAAVLAIHCYLVVNHCDAGLLDVVVVAL